MNFEIINTNLDSISNFIEKIDSVLYWFSIAILFLILLLSGDVFSFISNVTGLTVGAWIYTVFFKNYKFNMLYNIIKSIVITKQNE